MEREEPLISVIVPTYQRSDLLPRALDSILAQTWSRVEVIIADDNVRGSEWEQKTDAVLKSYADRMHLIRLKTAGQTGGGAARNLALQACRGEYVAFLDDDDRYLPDKLEKQVSFMKENNLDGSYHDVRWLNPDEKLVEYRRMDYTDDYSTEGLLKAHILHSIAPTGIYMFRREALLKTAGFGEVPSGQDFILMLRCIESGMKIAYLPGAYVIQYLHEGDRISVGESKFRGENALYQLKHRYFHLLTGGERQYVRFRHYAVLAFASLRGHQPLRAAGYAAVTLACSPVSCAKEAIRYFGGRFK